MHHPSHFQSHNSSWIPAWQRSWCSGHTTSVGNQYIMSSFPSDECDVINDHIISEDSPTDGDAVIVQPSFDDDKTDSKETQLSRYESWHRSPQQDYLQQESTEIDRQHPASPTRHPLERPGHTRDLSAHFFDATTLRNSSSEDSIEENVYKGPTGNRKHRRMMSGGISDPNYTHRRLNSIGQVATVKRHHQRVDSQGLDLLSVAATADEQDLKAFEPPTMLGQSRYPITTFPLVQHNNRRLNSNGLVFSPYPVYPPHPAMDPPVFAYPGCHTSPYYAPEVYAPNRAVYSRGPPLQYSSQHRNYTPHPLPNLMFPPPDKRSNKSDEAITAMAPESTNSKTKTTTAGSQTFVTAMAVGDGTKTLHPTNHLRPAPNNSDIITEGVPTHIGQRNHHRKMSSFSSLGLGTIFHSIMSEKGEPHPLKKEENKHHRSTSSSVSFLELGIDPDDTFLRHLHESSASDYCRPVGAPTTPKCEKDPSDRGAGSSSGSEGENGESRILASGGTSKRVRRKCSIAGCSNRVVQGGLCISHGAKRKLCKHPGCNKNVKKAGLCSTHGPARKRCEVHGCLKVAVQGGRCIAHGAKKKLCLMENCEKQAILSGMCKRHYDEVKEQRKETNSGAGTSKHTRGISIFHDLSADAVHTLLNNETRPLPSNTTW